MVLLKFCFGFVFVCVDSNIDNIHTPPGFMSKPDSAGIRQKMSQPGSDSKETKMGATIGYDQEFTLQCNNESVKGQAVSTVVKSIHQGCQMKC